MSSCWPDSAMTRECFVLKCVKHEGTIRTRAPLAALRHAVARRRFYPFSSFLPASLFNKVRPRGCLPFFCTHFDSAEMRFLCGDIRCSHTKDTDGSWLPVRRADIEKYIRTLRDIENINNCLHFNQSRVLAAQVQNTFPPLFCFILTDQLKLKMIPSCKNLTSLFHTIFPRLSFQPAIRLWQQLFTDTFQFIKMYFNIHILGA